MFVLSALAVVFGFNVATCNNMIADYDYIVVGSATGGVVASRLAENGNRVLLIEAGPDDLTYSCSSCNAKPFGDLIAGTPLIAYKHDWFNKGVTDLEWNDAISMPSYWHYNKSIKSIKPIRTETLWRAKMLGGCLSHNGHRWIRGSVRDYDYIANKLKLKDWSFNAVLPFYQKLETYLGKNRTLRGNDGPIKIYVSQLNEWDIKYKALFDAAIQCGIPYNNDMNGGYSNFGISYNEANINKYTDNKTGLFDTRFYRESSSQCYIRDIGLPSGYLTVWVNTVVQRIIFKHDTNTKPKAIGVEYYNDVDDIKKVYCKKEVIISAGTYKSPQLLMLSGIGPIDELNIFNITPIHINNNIGKYGQDHIYTLMTYRVNSTYLSDIPLLLKKGGYNYIEYKNEKDYFFIPGGLNIFLSSNTYDRLGYDYNDIHFACGGWGGDTKISSIIHPYIMCIIDTAVYSKNLTVKLQSDLDARKYPKVYENFYIDSRDYDIRIKGINKLREIFAFNKTVFIEEAYPGLHIRNDRELKEFIFKTSKASSHAVGTLSMGLNNRYPVDSKCSLRGVNGVRIVDVSIWPYSPNAGTMPLAFMIGEKCAHHIINDNKKYKHVEVERYQNIVYMISSIIINIVIMSIIIWIYHKKKKKKQYKNNNIPKP